jgi:uncharacterized damage-inducible protein DinB
MDIKTIRLLARYNQETNGKMNGFIAQLDEAEWRHEFPAFFPSIFAMCNHLYIADFNWLKRFSGLREFDYITDAVFAGELSFTADAFETRPEYFSKREYLDRLITAFTDEITRDDLKIDLNYTDTRGTEHTRNFGGMVLHVFNHQTHHRAMISVYLEMLGIENDYSNLAQLVR